MSAVSSAQLSNLSLTIHSPYNSTLESPTEIDPQAPPGQPSTSHVYTGSATEPHVFTFRSSQLSQAKPVILLTQEKIDELVRLALEQARANNLYSSWGSHEEITKIATNIVRAQHKKENLAKDLTIEALNEITKEIALQVLKTLDPLATPDKMLTALVDGQLTSRVQEINKKHFQELIGNTMSPKHTPKHLPHKREEPRALTLHVKNDSQERAQEETPPLQAQSEPQKPNQVNYLNRSSKHIKLKPTTACAPLNKGKRTPPTQNLFKSQEKEQSKNCCNDFCTIM